MDIEYISVALGIVGIGLFFFGFLLGQKSSAKPSAKLYDFSQGVKLEHQNNS